MHPSIHDEYDNPTPLRSYYRSRLLAEEQDWHPIEKSHAQASTHLAEGYDLLQDLFANSKQLDKAVRGHRDLRTLLSSKGHKLLIRLLDQACIMVSDPISTLLSVRSGLDHVFKFWSRWGSQEMLQVLEQTERELQTLYAEIDDACHQLHLVDQALAELHYQAQEQGETRLAKTAARLVKDHQKSMRTERDLRDLWPDLAQDTRQTLELLVRWLS